MDNICYKSYNLREITDKNIFYISNFVNVASSIGGMHRFPLMASPHAAGGALPLIPLFLFESRYFYMISDFALASH